jgi:hypothetical protein
MALRVAQVAVILVGLFAVVTIVTSSYNPDAYFHYAHKPRPPWEHPTTSVALVVGAAVLEVGILYAALRLRRPKRLWMRSLVGLGIITPWALAISEYVVHMPGYWLLHLLWVWAVLLGLLLLAVGSACLHAYSALRKGANA